MTAASTDTVERLLREYHRRLTHANVRWPDGMHLQVQGELIGLRGAVGIALGAAVEGGVADRMAQDRYEEWRGSAEAAAAVCGCRLCAAAC